MGLGVNLERAQEKAKAQNKHQNKNFLTHSVVKIEMRQRKLKNLEKFLYL
jgi:hypothetical protein